ncbi:Altered inheritance rate of mitochondria protein 29 [Kluyveromyces marxianus]|nr:Altered inheritance rate of mitochondria protein 29 [Kluyveromyces marxianus]KAG0686127.1 Altered inheritance rate of mitochondria protein 29 [Kluyveromyces marxianus]
MSTEIDFDTEEPLITTVRPLTNSTITVRVIKSFPYRNVKNIVFTDYDIKNKTAKDLYEDVINHIKTTGAFRPFRNVNYDALKVYTHAHGSKTVNLVINFDHDDDWTLDINDSTKKLVDYGISNETELSLFNHEDYIAFKANPEEKWL